MKKIIAGLAITLLAMATVQAQKPEQPMQQHRSFRQHGREGFAKLQFSDQQKQQLKNINSDYHKKLADLNKNEDITVREFKARMASLHKDHRSQLQALLTPDQKNQLAKMRQEKMQMAKVDASARAEKMKIKLGLSDAQAGQLKTIRTDMVAKMKRLHTDSTLSQEQKRAQMKNIVLQQKDQLKNILTPEQMQQLEQIKKDGFQRHRRDFTR